LSILLLVFLVAPFLHATIVIVVLESRELGLFYFFTDFLLFISGPLGLLALLLLLFHHVVKSLSVLSSLTATELLLNVILKVVINVEISILGHLEHPVGRLNVLVVLETSLLRINSCFNDRVQAI
jgi:hypothetical protein